MTATNGSPVQALRIWDEGEMTLIVGGIEGAAVWLCADSAITDPALPLRIRKYQPKVEALDEFGLLGFAGPVDLGVAAISEASTHAPGRPTIELLQRINIENSRVEFLYGYLVDNEPQLARIANGEVEHSATFFIGDQTAYERYQEIRLSNAIDHAPDAIHQLICAPYKNEKIPQGLYEAVCTMLKQFVTTQDRAVGGWPSPHMLTSTGPSMCAYGYAVTDPITRVLQPGQLIPHGTAESGGFNFSFCPLREHDGIVVYWLQRPGGKVFIRNGATYEEYDFAGRPQEFKAAVSESLGRDVGLWFDDEPMGQPEIVEIMRDEAGEPRIYVAKSGNKFSFSWANNLSTSFRAKAPDFSETPSIKINRNLGDIGVTIKISDDAKNLSLNIQNKPINLSANEVDDLISALVTARMELKDELPFEPPATQLDAIVNPTWRTLSPPHPGIPGPMLLIRHPGHGWLAFILPNHEAKSLGEWFGRYTADIETAQANSTENA